MDKWHKGLGGLLILALICIIFLQQCNKCPEAMEVVKIDTTKYITIYDTIWHDTARFKYIAVNVPRPYYDTILVKINDFEDFDQDFILKYPAIYTDIISDDTVSIEYTARVRGYLDDIKIGYKLLQPLLIEQTTLIETEVTKREKTRPVHLYIGIDIGANKDKFGYFAPELELTTRRYNYSAGFNILDKSLIIGLKRRIL